MCTGILRGTNPSWLTLSAYRKAAMMTRIATLVWQLVEAAGSVVGLRYGTQGFAATGGVARGADLVEQRLLTVIAIGRADIPQSAGSRGRPLAGCSLVRTVWTAVRR
jgi:hypothetical protein